MHIPDELLASLPAFGTLIGTLDRDDNIIGEVPAIVSARGEGIQVLLHRLPFIAHDGLPYAHPGWLAGRPECQRSWAAGTFGPFSGRPQSRWRAKAHSPSDPGRAAAASRSGARAAPSLHGAGPP